MEGTFRKYYLITALIVLFTLVNRIAGQLTMEFTDDHAPLGGGVTVSCTDTRLHAGASRVQLQIFHPSGLSCASWSSDNVPVIGECDSSNLCALQFHRYIRICPAEIDGSATLQIMISALQPADIGIWGCSVHVDDALDSGTTARLDEFFVAGAPSVLYPPIPETSLDLVDRISQTLTCQAAFGLPSAPPHKLAWYVERSGGESEQIVQDTEWATPGSIYNITYFPNILDNEGTITCRADQQIPATGNPPQPSEGIPITVIGKMEMSLQVVPPSITNIWIENDLLLPCGFHGNPTPSITVSGGEIPLSHEIVLDAPVVGAAGAVMQWEAGATLGERRRAHGRTVTCYGRQEYVTSASPDPIVRESDMSTELNIMYPPDRPVALRVEPAVINVNQETTFTCEVIDTGNPPASEFRWYRNGELVTTSMTNTLVYTPTDIREAGDFQCSCVSFPPLLPSQPSELSDSTPLAVNVPAQLFFQPVVSTRMRAYTEPSLFVTCRAIGFPDLTFFDFRWFIGTSPVDGATPGVNVELAIEETGRVGYGLEREFVSTMTRTFSLPDQFTCDNVEMFDEPILCAVAPGELQLSLTQVQTLYPAIWRHNPWREVHNYIIGNDLELHCDVCMRPVGVYIWLRNGDIIEGETSEFLVIQGLTEDHTGDYKCMVVSYAAGAQVHRNFTTRVEVRPVGMLPGQGGGAIDDRPHPEDIAVYCILGVMGVSIIALAVMLVNLKRTQSNMSKTRL